MSSSNKSNQVMTKRVVCPDKVARNADVTRKGNLSVRYRGHRFLGKEIDGVFVPLNGKNGNLANTLVEEENS